MSRNLAVLSVILISVLFPSSRQKFLLMYSTSLTEMDTALLAAKAMSKA